jgi:hypothetical protein
MAQLMDDLWRYNMAKLVIVDVTDDYHLMQPPMPSDCYPVIAERWVSSHNLRDRLPSMSLLEGYYYDWHEKPKGESPEWVVGVVNGSILAACGAQTAETPA